MLQRCTIRRARHFGDPVCLVVGVGRGHAVAVGQLRTVAVDIVGIGCAQCAVLVNSGQTI